MQNRWFIPKSRRCSEIRCRSERWQREREGERCSTGFSLGARRAYQAFFGSRGSCGGSGIEVTVGAKVNLRKAWLSAPAKEGEAEGARTKGPFVSQRADVGGRRSSLPSFHCRAILHDFPTSRRIDNTYQISPFPEKAILRLCQLVARPKANSDPRLTKVRKRTWNCYGTALKCVKKMW